MTTKPDMTPTKSSTDEYWVSWYDELVSFFNKKDAKAIFRRFWEKRGIGTKANTKSLRDQMRERGVNIIGDGFFDDVADSVGGFTDGIGNVFSSLLGIGKIGAYVAIGLTAVVVGGVIYSLVKRGVSFNPVTKSVSL